MYGVHKRIHTTKPVLKSLQFQPPTTWTLDSSLAVLASQTGTTSSERGRVMPTIDARAGRLWRWNVHSTPILTSLDADVRQTWLVTVLDEVQLIFLGSCILMLCNIYCNHFINIKCQWICLLEKIVEAWSEREIKQLSQEFMHLHNVKALWTRNSIGTKLYSLSSHNLYTMICTVALLVFLFQWPLSNL